MSDEEDKITEQTPILPQEQPATIPPRPSLLRRFLRFMIRFIIRTSFVLLVLHLFLMFFAGALLRPYISDFVAKRTDSLYQLTYSNMSIDVFGMKMNFNGVVLHPDTAIYHRLLQQQKIKHGLYNIRFDRLRIGRINPLSIWSDSSIHLTFLALDRPDISLIDVPFKKEKHKSESYDGIRKDLYPTITRLIQGIRVDWIEINDGALNLTIHEGEREKSSAESVTIYLEDFYLTKNILQREQDIFLAKNIEIIIKNYMLHLNDSIHTLLAKRVHLSTRDSIIAAEEVSLQADQEATGLDKKTVYNASIDAIRLHEANIKRLFTDKILQINKVELNHPTITLISPVKQEGKKRTKLVRDINLYQLIQGKLEGIAIDTFQLRDAKFAMYRRSNQNQALFSVESLSVSFTKFEVDSLSEQSEEKILYANEIMLDMKGYYMRLKDDVHYLKAGSLQVSTAQQRIIAGDVQLAYTPQGLAKVQYTHKTAFDINIPNIMIEGIDMHDVYNRQGLPINSFILQNAHVKIYSYAELKRKQNKKNTDAQVNLKELITNYVNNFNIGYLALWNGTFDLINYDKTQAKAFSKGNLTVEARNFSLNNNATDSSAVYAQLFYADDLAIRMNNYSLKLPNNIHILKVKNFALSTSQSSILIDSVSFRPQFNNDTIQTLKNANRRSFIDISVPRMSVSDADIHKAFFDKELTINKFSISNPSFKIFRYAGIKKRSADTLTNNEIKPDTTLIADTLDIIKVDSITPQIGEAIKIELKKDTAKTNNIDSIIAIGNVYKSTNSLDSIRQLLLQYNELAELGPLRSWVEQIEVTQPTLNDSIQTNIITTNNTTKNDSLYPQHGIVIADTNALAAAITTPIDTILSKEDNIHEIISRYLEFINIDTFLIDNGNIVLSNNDTTGRSLFYFDNRVSVNMENFLFNSDSADTDKRVLFSDRVAVRIKDYRIDIPDKTHTLIASEIGFRSDRSEIYAEKIRLLPIAPDSTQGRNYWYAYIPSAVIRGLDLERLYMENQLSVEQILVNAPIIRYLVNNNTANPRLKGRNKKNPRSKSIKVPNNFPSISVKSLLLDEASFRIVLSKTSEPVTRARVSVSLSNFYLDTLTSEAIQNPLLLFDNVNLVVSRFKHNLPDKVSELSVDYARYSVSDSQLVAQNIDIQPIYSHSNTKKSTYQTHIPRIEVQGFDLFTFLRNKSLNINNINILEPDVQLHTTSNTATPTKPRKSVLDVNLAQKLPKTIKSVKIDNINVQDIWLTIHGSKSNQKSIQNFSDLHLNIQNFYLDSTTKQSAQRLFYADDITLEARNLNYTMSKTPYRASIKNIKLSTATSSIIIDQCEYHTIYSRYGIADSLQLKHTKGFTDVIVPRIKLKNVDLISLLEKKKLYASSLELENAQLLSFADRYQRTSDTSRRPPMPMKFLLNAPIPIRIDSLLISNGYLLHEENTQNAENIGRVFINKLDVQMQNITNDSLLLVQNPHLRVRVLGMLMGTGQMKANFRFNMTDPHFEHKYNGSLGEMDLQPLNPFVRNVARIDIKSGHLKNVRFSVTSNDSVAQGLVLMRYDNLNIDLLDNKDTTKRQGFLSFFANSYLPDRNPKGVRMRYGDTFFKRDVSKTLFNYWVNTLITGVKTTMGLIDKRSKQEIKEIRKNRKIQRRELRKQRKDDKKAPSMQSNDGE